MHIRVGYDIIYGCPAPTPMTLLLNVRPERSADLVTPDSMRLEPEIPVRRRLDGFGNICTRLVAPEGPVRFSSDFIVSDSGEPDPVSPQAIQHGVDALPSDAMVYLLASRYCDVDRLGPLAWSLFGDVAPGWSRVQAICDYVHDNIAFDYMRADATRSASEALAQGVGVCRDFAHLAITLCRCMHIPARYCTGYLGDIGVPPRGVMDFSAWFEAYLGGGWRTFDARHNIPRIGRIVMAHGRDATDTAISTTFGVTTLERFEVVTEEVGEDACVKGRRAPLLQPRQWSSVGPRDSANGASQGS
jgi:transglutaminase-like putative cysteine protease